MSTQYSNTLKFHNEWTMAIKGVWVAYSNSGTGTRFFDQLLATPLAVGGDVSLSPPDPAIASVTGDTDHWTVTILDEDNRLWGTEMNVSGNIPHMNGEIEITVMTTPGKPIEWAVFRFPDGESEKFPLTRI